MSLNIEPSELKEKMCEMLRPEMSVVSFNTYIQPLVIEHIDHSNIVLQCDADYKKDML